MRRTLAQTFAHLVLPGLNLARLTLGLLDPQGADLQDLDFDLSDASSRAGDPRRDVARLTVELRRLPLKREQPGKLRQALFEQRSLRRELARNKAALALDRLGLRLEAHNLFAHLPDPLAKLRRLTLPRGAPGLEEPTLAVENLPHRSMRSPPAPRDRHPN